LRQTEEGWPPTTIGVKKTAKLVAATSFIDRMVVEYFASLAKPGGSEMP
jgi:hypothetical protein